MRINIRVYYNSSVLFLAYNNFIQFNRMCISKHQYIYIYIYIYIHIFEQVTCI